MPAIQFEPMDIGRILDQTFRLYRRNFTRFLAIVAIVQVPVGLLGLLLTASLGGASMSDSGAMGPMGMDATSEMPVITGAAIGGIFFGSFLALLGLTLSQAALVKTVSESYLGNDVSIGQAYRFILPKVVTIIAASILVGLVVMCGFLLLIVPGIIFTVWYALTTQIIVIEDCGATDAMRRSKALTSGNRGKVLSVIVLAALLTWIISMVGNFVGTFVAGSLAADSTLAMFIVQNAAGIVSNVVSAPISAAAVILLYYDLRIRKEGFDLQMLADRLGAEQPQHADDLSE